MTLIGLFGKAKEIIDKLGADLDISVSSRASQTTANSILSAVNSIDDGIKRVQRGVTSVDLTSTSDSPQVKNVSITSVDTSRAFVILSVIPVVVRGSTSTYTGHLNARLTSSSNLRITAVIENINVSIVAEVAWEVVEFS